MKKRFLLIVLCLTICVVGLPFTANAVESENFVLDLAAQAAEYLQCPCGGDYEVLYTGGYEVIHEYAQPNLCCYRKYYAVRVECLDCGDITDVYDIYETRYKHLYLTYTFCQDCGFIKP